MKFGNEAASFWELNLLYTLKLSHVSRCCHPRSRFQWNLLVDQFEKPKKAPDAALCKAHRNSITSMSLMLSSLRTSSLEQRYIFVQQIRLHCSIKQLVRAWTSFLDFSCWICSLFSMKMPESASRRPAPWSWSIQHCDEMLILTHHITHSLTTLPDCPLSLKLLGH